MTIASQLRGGRMRYDIAESILRSTMENWSTQKMSEEARDIQIISEIKYDDYQQYTHGMRYVESLALWLRQFEGNDRELAYEMIKNLLIYISEEEMRQLITYSYSIIMQKYLLGKTRLFCEQKGIIDVDNRKEIYNFFRRCSLFLGLSDGAHMDFFRRQNSDLSNEQVFLHYDFSPSKAVDMENELKHDPVVLDVIKKYPDEVSIKFNSIFLIDDFTASGKSYIRQDNSGWHGKIKRFFDTISETCIDSTSFDVHIVLYVATEKALETIRKQVNLYLNDKKTVNKHNVTVDALQIVEAINWDNNQYLLNLLKRNFEKSISAGYHSFVDKHFEKGEGKEPYLGFADCSLPLVLYHNTPNNTLPIIWYSWDDAVDALFPRITRHKAI